MENSPRPNLPSPATPLQKSAFSFDDKDLLTPKMVAKSPLNRSPSFLSKISADQRRKLAEKEAIDELDHEAVRVKTLNLNKSSEPFSPEDLEQGEKRLYIDPRSAQDATFIDVTNILEEWVNDVLNDDFMRVTSMTDDFYDGVILKKIVEKLSGFTIQLPLSEDVQAKERQKLNLKTVLEKVRQILRLSTDLVPWTLEGVFEKNLLYNLQILLSLIEHFTPEGKILLVLPKMLSIHVVEITKVNGRIESHMKPLTLIKNSGRKDGFDSLFETSPEKINPVKRNLLKFCNKLLNKLDIKVEDLSKDFSNGVNLILLIGLVQGFFVPLYEYFSTPQTFEEKLHNVNLALHFMDELDVKRRNQPSEIIRGDLKATMRIIYILFVKHADDIKDQ